MKDVLLYFAYRYKGDWDEIYNALDRKEKFDFEECERIKAELAEDTHVVTILDSEYPYSLKQIYKPPFVLFCKGDMELLNAKGVAVEGTTNPTEHGIENATELTEELIRDGQIVITGFNEGINANAHKVAKELEGYTIAVMHSGIDNVHPVGEVDLYKDLIQNNLVVSEYPEDTKQTKTSVQDANRIVTGISHGVVVVECEKKSQSTNLAETALEQGKELYAYPAIPNSLLSGCNDLLKNSDATLVENAHDVLIRVSGGRTFAKKRIKVPGAKKAVELKKSKVESEEINDSSSKKESKSMKM